MAQMDPLALLEPAATRVRDPVSRRSVWLAGMVRNSRVDDGRLKFDLVFNGEHTREDRRAIEQALTANLTELGVSIPVVVMARLDAAAPSGGGGAKSDPVPGMSGPGMGPHGGPIQKKPIPGVANIIAVASGKGGVGKSTIATNVSVGLAQLGHRVGLLDADIYGPSLPLMMRTSERPLVDEHKRILPVMAHGVRCLSVGLLVDADQAMIWRGPMVMGLVRQFLQQTHWGDLDYLIIDLPPGTGDAQLTLVQAVELTGAVIVTTPQEVALADAVRGISMFRQLEVPLLGVVENMAYYVLPDGTRDYVFGRAGGARIAEQQGTRLLAELPLQTSIRRSGDEGLPAVLREGSAAQAFQALARAVVECTGDG